MTKDGSGADDAYVKANDKGRFRPFLKNPPADLPKHDNLMRIYFEKTGN